MVTCGFSIKKEMTSTIKSTEEDKDVDLKLSGRRLGTKLRFARRTKGLTLKQLAERSECSESLLSRIENGKTLPSLPLIHRLVRVLETNISWLFEESDPEETPISCHGERPVITLERQADGGRGVSLERIIPFKRGHLLQCNIHHLEVGGQSGDAITHDGEEVGYVLQGVVELVLDDEAHRLEPGDAFCFKSYFRHSYRNLGTDRASILWVCTPPTF